MTGVPPVCVAAPRGAARIAEAAVPALVLALGAALPPDRPIPFDLCLWHRLTGIDCLGCGLTRSVCHLMHGDVAQSLALHPAGVIVVALAAVLLVRGLLVAAAPHFRPAARFPMRAVTRRG